MKPDTATIIDRLSASLRRNDNAATATHLVEYEVAMLEPETARLQQGLADLSTELKQVVDIRKNKLTPAIINTFQAHLNDYEMQAPDLKHKQRRQRLETIIRILQPVCDDKEKRSPDEQKIPSPEEKPSPQLLLILAKAYLYRGMLFRPKGFTVPARKIEALQKAEKTAAKAKDADSGNTDAWRVWGASVLELQSAIGDDFKLPSNLIADAAKAIQKDGIRMFTDLGIVLADGIVNNNNTSLEKVLAEPDDWDRKGDLHLYKARAVYKLGKVEETVQHLEQALLHAPTAMSSPFWEDFVGFLNFLKDKTKIWEPIAIEAHALCREMERQVKSNVYLCWHWPRRKLLYDLAFLASEENRKAAVADSVKSRPALRYKALHAMQDKVRELKKILDQENEERDGRYLKKAPKIIKKEIPADILSAAKIPKGWTAIHLYLLSADTGSMQGYALIYNRKSGWKERPFNYEASLKAYTAWQEAHSTGISTNRSDAMVALCRKLGSDLYFLFKDSPIPEGDKVLWIPHGFLHRVPLHAAIDDDTGSVFLEQHASAYLPAWNLAAKKSAKIARKNCLLHALEETEFDQFEKLAGLEWTKKEDRKTDLDMLNTEMKAGWDTLAVLCHGKSDATNSFRSRLILSPFPGTILDILQTPAKLSGARVMLAACESDMAPPADRPVDEHVSLGTAFLSHGAAQVLAGLWRLGFSHVDDCYAAIRDSDDWVTALNVWQKERIESWKDKNKNKDKAENAVFFHAAPFRITGFSIDEPDQGETP